MKRLLILFLLFYSSVNAQWFNPKEFDQAYDILKRNDCDDCNYFKVNKTVEKEMLNLNIGIQNRIKDTWFVHIETLKKDELEQIKNDSIIKNESLNTNLKNKRRPLSHCFDHYPTFLENFLLSQKELIVPEYFKNVFKYKIVSDEIFEILGIFNLPQILRDSILHHPLTPLKVKAKLGDRNAEDVIIKKFNVLFEEDSLIRFSQYDDSQFKEFLKPLVFDLLYIGSSNTLNAYFKILQSSISRSALIKETDSLLYIEKKPVVYPLLDIYNVFYYNELFYFQKMLSSSENIWKLEQWEKDKIYVKIISDYLSSKHKTNISISESKRDFIIFTPKYKMSDSEILQYVIKHPL